MTGLVCYMSVVKSGRSGTQISLGCDFYSMVVTRTKVGGFCYSSNANKHLLHEILQLNVFNTQKGNPCVKGRRLCSCINLLLVNPTGYVMHQQV